jgi:hypothetical protein
MTAVAPASAGRLVRIEIKRSAAVWVLPLLAALFPGRFTTPLVTVGISVVELAAFQESVSRSGPLAFALLSPSTAVPANDSGVFYPVAPDLAIVQVMFMAGTAIGLAATATQGVSGWNIPVLHDAARNAGVSGTPSYAPAQQAVVIALMRAVGSRPTSNSPFTYAPAAASQTQITAAADRFAALSASARHAWLATHLTALQSGHITLEQLP